MQLAKQFSLILSIKAFALPTAASVCICACICDFALEDSDSDAVAEVDEDEDPPKNDMIAGDGLCCQE